MHFIVISMAIGCLGGLVSTKSWAATSTEGWPQFRGPAGDGVALGSSPPAEFGESKNVVWKTAIHGKGWSSPVVLGDRIWLTTATEDGRELSVLALERASGKIILDRVLFRVENPQFCHKFNSYASPSPVMESGRVYVTFGSPATACLDGATGQVLWERRDLVCNHFRGAGSSPILHGNLLLMHYDGSDHQYVIALDKMSGRTVWKSTRSIDFRDLKPDGTVEAEGDYRKAFATPHVARLGGRDVLLSQGARALYGYDPLSGMELWRLEARVGHSGSTRPSVARDWIYFSTGFSQAELWAVRLPSDGKVTEQSVVWKDRRSVPEKPSLILSGAWVFMIDDGGIASCLDAESGVERWRERIGGNYSASPVLAGQRMYFPSEEGKVTVVEAGGQFVKLAENVLGDGFMASPAVIGNDLILRSRSHLYCVGVR